MSPFLCSVRTLLSVELLGDFHQLGDGLGRFTLAVLRTAPAPTSVSSTSTAATAAPAPTSASTPMDKKWFVIQVVADDEIFADDELLGGRLLADRYAPVGVGL